MSILNNYTLSILVVIALTLSFLAGRYFRNIELKQDLETLARYKSTYLIKSGWTDNSDYYHLFSCDAGNNWYAMGKDGVSIIGPAEEIYPGLVRHLEKENSLIKYSSDGHPAHRT